MVGTLAVAAGWAASSLHTPLAPPPDRQGLDVHEQHAAASLTGQFRTSVAAWLWVRTDLYLHNGVEMRPMTDAERRSGARGASPAQGSELHDESSLTTIVPEAEHDFRGWLGHLERATQAYKPMAGHEHRDPESALPLFRLMTWADPGFERGWSVGAAILGNGRSSGANQSAIAFLREAVRANPHSIALRTDLSQMLLVREAAYDEAMPLLTDVVRDAARTPPRDPDALEALQRAFRWLAIGYRDTGRPESAKQVARTGLRQFGDDLVLARYAYPPPLVLNREGQSAYVQARVTSSL